MLHDYTQMTDDELCSLWRGDDCPSCTESLSRWGQVLTYCATCGISRERGDPLILELHRRGLLGRIWPEKEAGCEH